MPAWVSEGSVRKYHRAVAQLEKENTARKLAGQPIVPVTEADVKALYEKWGGLVLGEPESVKGVEKGDEEAAAARAAEAQGTEVKAPKKK